MADWDHDFQLGDLVEAIHWKENLNPAVQKLAVGKIVQLDNISASLDNGRVFRVVNLKKIETPKPEPMPEIEEITGKPVAKPTYEELEAEIELLKAERKYNSKEYNAFIDDIWAIVGDGKGSWDYPGQVIRYAGYLKEECDKLKSNKAAMRAFNLSNQMSQK